MYASLHSTDGFSMTFEKFAHCSVNPGRPACPTQTLSTHRKTMCLFALLSVRSKIRSALHIRFPIDAGNGVIRRNFLQPSGFQVEPPSSTEIP